MAFLGTGGVGGASTAGLAGVAAAGASILGLDPVISQGKAEFGEEGSGVGFEVGEEVVHGGDLGLFLVALFEKRSLICVMGYHPLTPSCWKGKRK
jgi:hypothetical protein